MNTKLFVFAWFFAVISPSMGYSQTSFDLLQGQSCSSSYQSFCDATEPKGWSVEEKQFIEDSIANLNNLGLTQFLNSVRANGFTKITRYGYGFTITPIATSMYQRRAEIFAFTNSVTHTISLTDYFFKNPISIDPISLRSPRDMTLLHELVHARDKDGVFSGSQEFLSLANFSGGDFMGVSLEELNTIKEKIYDRNQISDYNGAYLIERNFGIAHGFPRLYSMTSPAEALADIAAFIVYDSTANTYIDPKLYDWVREKVLLIK